MKFAGKHIIDTEDSEMFVKLTLIDGNTELFETQNFVCAPVKSMKPEIVKCEVFDGAGIRRFKAERRFKAFYKRFIYKPEEKK